MSKRLHTVPFEPAHFDVMELRSNEAARFELDPQNRQKIQALAAHGVGATLMYDGRILAIVGYYELWAGCYELWVLPSVYIPQYAIVYLRAMRLYLSQIEDTLKPKRLQTSSLADKLHNDWMLSLGFTLETPGGMKHYSITGETFNMWSRTYVA